MKQLEMVQERRRCEEEEGIRKRRRNEGRRREGERKKYERKHKNN